MLTLQQPESFLWQSAAGVVLGRNTIGWVEWKYHDGKMLNEVKR
jgi:hypothetical protein